LSIAAHSLGAPPTTPSHSFAYKASVPLTILDVTTVLTFSFTNTP